jgi:DNA gyrase subunit B
MLGSGNRQPVMALGTGIGCDEFNIDKLRYHKIVTATDADVDGRRAYSHAVDAFFFRQMPQLTERGHLHCATATYRRRAASPRFTKDRRDERTTRQNRRGCDVAPSANAEIGGADLRRVVDEVGRLKRA